MGQYSHFGERNLWKLETPITFRNRGSDCRKPFSHRKSPYLFEPVERLLRRIRRGSQGLFASGLPLGCLEGIQFLIRSIAIVPLHVSRQVTCPELPFQFRLTETGAIESRGILLDSLAICTSLRHRIATPSIVGTTRFLPEYTVVPNLNRLAYSAHGYRLPSMLDFRLALQRACQLRYKKIELPIW